MALEREVAATKSGLSQVRQRLQFEQQRIEQTKSRIGLIGEEKSDLLKALALIDRAIAVVSANGIEKIESIVTSGMRLAFDDPTLGFKVVKKESARGNTYALEGVRGDVQGPFMETFGGGISNIVAFLLRVIMLKRFKLAKILVVDESFNNVAVKFLPMVSRMLRDLTDNHGYTILAVTHQPILAAAADNIYRVVPNASTKGAPPKLVRVHRSELGEIFQNEE
jgi:DNA repair ATPase RecN